MSFFFFLYIDLCLLISAITAQTFNSFAELVISIGIPSNKAKPEMEIDPVTIDTKIRMFSS